MKFFQSRIRAAASLTVIFFAVLSLAAARLVDYLQTRGSVIVWGDYLLLRLAPNYHGAFGAPLAGWAVIAFSVAVLAGAGWIFFRSETSAAATAGFAAIVAGGLGNIIERLRFGFVHDFLIIRAAGLVGSWNFNDLAILLGLAVWLLSIRRTQDT